VTAQLTTTATHAISGDACSPQNRPLNLTGFSTTFASANYPSDYNNDADCQWLITAVEADGVSVFFSRFIASHTVANDPLRIFVIKYL